KRAAFVTTTSYVTVQDPSAFWLALVVVLSRSRTEGTQRSTVSSSLGSSPVTTTHAVFVNSTHCPPTPWWTSSYVKGTGVPSAFHVASPRSAGSSRSTLSS